MPRRWKILLAISPIAIALDQLTKYLARAALPVDGSGRGLLVPFIDGYWDWVLSQNTGAAFSLFDSTTGSRVFLALVALVAIGAILWFTHKARDEQTWFIVSLSLMIGGAIGNLIDRVAFGSVTDFVLWHYHEHMWPVFNVADVFLSIAVVILIATSVSDSIKNRALTRS
jgi:signal peptidase II